MSGPCLFIGGPANGRFIHTEGRNFWEIAGVPSLIPDIISPYPNPHQEENMALSSAYIHTYIRIALSKELNVYILDNATAFADRREYALRMLVSGYKRHG